MTDIENLLYSVHLKEITGLATLFLIFLFPSPFLPPSAPSGRVPVRLALAPSRAHAPSAPGPASSVPASSGAGPLGGRAGARVVEVGDRGFGLGCVGVSLL